MEENQVREKIAQLLKQHALNGWNYYVVADLILQSPDLRVTLVRPTYRWIGRCVYRFLEVTTTEIAQCIDAEHAREYCEWLNSKEPK